MSKTGEPKAPPSKGGRVLTAIGLLLAPLALGGFLLATGQAQSEIFVTDSLVIRPYDQPLAFLGFFYAQGLLVVGALALAWGVVWFSFAKGFFGLLVAAVMGGMSLIAVALLMFAPEGEFDLGQKVVFSFIALFFGFMAAWYAFNDVKRRLGGGEKKA